jgi:dGTPase
LEDGRERFFFYEEVFARRASEPFWKKTAREDFEQAFLDIVVQFEGSEPFDGSREDRAELRSFTGKLIDRYISGLTSEVDGSTVIVRKNPEHEKEIAMLKELTWHYVINAQSMATHQHGQKEIISGLFEIYLDAAQSKKSKALFPIYYQQRLKEAVTYEAQVRTVVDFIAGLTESQAVALYQQLKGVSLGFGLSSIV